jgi:glycosyltransferase involved in cell wall biosynthesis
LKDARLTIVGNGQDKDRLVRLTNRLNINDKVVFKSNLSREELLQEYVRAKLFILVSEYESFGIAAVEAIAMGIPTVVNNASALVEFVKSNAAVGIDPPITTDKVADAIIKAMNFKPINVRDKLITWDEVANRLEKLYLEYVLQLEQ